MMEQELRRIAKLTHYKNGKASLFKSAQISSMFSPSRTFPTIHSSSESCLMRRPRIVTLISCGLVWALWAQLPLMRSPRSSLCCRKSLQQAKGQSKDRVSSVSSTWCLRPGSMRRRRRIRLAQLEQTMLTKLPLAVQRPARAQIPVHRPQQVHQMKTYRSC